MGIKLDIELLAEIITNEIMKIIKALPNNQPLEEPKGKETVHEMRKSLKGRAVCMEDLKGMESCELEVERGAVITPLAKDYLREKKIRIVNK